MTAASTPFIGVLGGIMCGVALLRSLGPAIPAWRRRPGVSPYRSPPVWSRLGPLATSILLHGVIFAGLIGWLPSAPTRSLPQIELLPPAPIPSLSQEAAPSPPEAPPNPIPVFPTLAPKPLPHVTPRPITTRSNRAEFPLPKPPEPPREKPTRDSSSDAAPDDPRLTRDAAALAAPVKGTKRDDALVIGESPAHPQAAGPPPDYLGLVRAQLERVKRYPPAARAAGQEGTVVLGFVLAQSGQLVSWRIATASGIPALDEEVATMIQSAKFPPFPSLFSENDLLLLVPVRFSLKDREPR